MDELDELVTAARPPAAPTAAVTAAHRAALRATTGTEVVRSRLSAEPGTMARPEGEAIPVTGRDVVPLSAARAGHRPRWLAVAAAVAVVAAGIVATAAVAGDDRESVEAGPAAQGPGDRATSATPPADPASSTCGPVRFRMPPPPGFADPTETVEGEQVVHRYRSDGGATIELRWPGLGVLGDRVIPTGDSTGIVVSSTTATDEHGTTITMRFLGLALGEPPCDTIAVTIVAPDASTAGYTAVAVQDIVLHPGTVAAGSEAVPLIVSTAEATEVPTVGPCENGAANLYGTVRPGPPVAEPAAALQEFIATELVSMEEYGVIVDRPRHPTAGYAELLLPDGRRAYAHHPTGDGFVATLVVVRPLDGGWVLDRWESSAC